MGGKSVEHCSIFLQKKRLYLIEGFICTSLLTFSVFLSFFSFDEVYPILLVFPESSNILSSLLSLNRREKSNLRNKLFFLFLKAKLTTSLAF